MFITSNKGPSKLKLGHPVMSDKYNAVPFVLAADTPKEILVGAALMATDVQGTYAAVNTSKTVVVADNVNKVVGFILGNNVKVPTVFPAAGPDYMAAGEAGACLVEGAIAVKYAGENAPKEEDKVYIVTVSTVEGYEVGDITDGAVVQNVTKVQLPGWRFMGITDTDEGVTVAAIHRGY